MATTSTQLRFRDPIDTARPRGAARFEFWAPKISRRISLFDPLQVRLWTLLESAPFVHAYCERPAYSLFDGRRQLIDFWVKAGRREACWILAPESRSEGADTVALNPTTSMNVRYIHATSLDSRDVWIENWMRILPYLAANERFVSDGLLRDVEQATILASPTLGEIERDFQSHDIVLVRTAVFMLLHRGRIRADLLRVHPLGPGIPFRRLPT